MQILHGAKICPAADFLASHTPYPYKISHFLSIKGVLYMVTPPQNRACQQSTACALGPPPGNRLIVSTRCFKTGSGS